MGDKRSAEVIKYEEHKECSFTEFQCWVMTNFLFSTGVNVYKHLTGDLKGVTVLNDIYNQNGLR